MRRMTTVLTIVATAALMAGVSAQGKPSFAGKWTVVADPNAAPPAGGGGEPMFRALRYLKRPVVMVRFPGETHELSRSGAPWHRVERLQHILGWFDKYLRGKGGEQYDVD